MSIWKVGTSKLVKKNWYDEDYLLFKQLLGDQSVFPLYKSYPCLNDKDAECATVELHYFHQDLYVAKKVFENKPVKHVDIGSRLDGFVAHLLSFREVEIFDVRPLSLDLPGAVFTQADITDETTVPVDYCDSISCLHALEHFGLGRYGDRIDPDGHIKGFHSITKALKQGGVFYFSVPMGKQRIEFNAHRVFSMPYLIDLVSKDYTMVSFAYVDDANTLHQCEQLSEDNIRMSFGCNYGCAIFELRKK